MLGFVTKSVISVRRRNEDEFQDLKKVGYFGSTVHTVYLTLIHLTEKLAFGCALHSVKVAGVYVAPYFSISLVLPSSHRDISPLRREGAQGYQYLVLMEIVKYTGVLFYHGARLHNLEDPFIWRESC